jgi:hypothetical protein
MENLNAAPKQNAPKPSAAATCSAIHGATYHELDDANAALCAENAKVREVANKLMRVCYDEANRIANHCSDGAAKWAMQNLYDAANEAKARLSPNAELSDSRPL